MPDDLLDDYRRRLLDRYREQPGEFDERLRRLDESAVRAPIKPGEWSAHQVLFHVLSVDEQAYGPRLFQILNETRPDLPDFDEPRWMQEHYDAGRPPQALLERWADVRRRNAAALAAVPAEAWSRTGRHGYWGERTLQWWLERAIAHADEHRRQLDGE